MAVHNLPHATASFINRVSEIAEITQYMNDADCRLLTLVGPGGIGKTRLAMRIADDCSNQFDDGVYFIPLQPLESPELLVSAIADVVNFSFSPAGNPQEQLLQYLREKELLLLLDNFEHLLDGGKLLTAILAAAPNIKLLVTSREVLNLQEEWLYRVRGLHYPAPHDTENPEGYSAVQLFVERARQVRGDLALAEEHGAVVRVCQLVEGMPLALELAAAWTKTLTTKDIAMEIQRNLDFLSTSLRNIPQRHQSMQAVFEQTWKQLSDEERRVFRALSVFSGGFRREAAQAVVDVSMRTLSDLVDKSLLTSIPDGRYQMHELLRQYAEAQLETMPYEVNSIHDFHSAYYANFMGERHKDLNGGRQREACLEIEADIDNIRTAWSWAVEHSKIEAIDQSEHALLVFYAIQSRHLEGIGAFEKAARVLDNGDPRTEILLARVLCSLGGMCSRGGALEKARVMLERSWLLYSQHTVLPAPGEGLDPRVMLAYIYLYQGRNIKTVSQLLGEAFQDNTLRKDHFNLPIACFLLAMLARVQGNYEEAKQYAQQGYNHTVITGDLFIRPNCLNELSAICLLTGDLAGAKQRIKESYVIREDLGDPKGMAEALIGLGRIALLESDNAEARRCYERARTICHDRGDYVGLAAALEGMGNSASAMGHYGEARRYLHEALNLSLQQMVSRTLSIFVGVGELFLQTGKQARGIEILTLTLHYPVSDQDTKDRAQRLLSRYPTATELVQLTLTNADFDVVITTLLDELQIPVDTILTRHAPYTDQPLVEPLSEREQMVLRLIAEERSNREIAEHLFLSVATVKWYLTHIYSKLGVQNRTLAIMRARQLNFLP